MAQVAADRLETVAAAPVANPAVLGLSGFALTTFVLSSINAGWFPAGATPIVVGLAIFYGGLSQLLAGMWEFKAGNTFGATAFTSYGAFWISFGVIFVPGFGIGSTLGAALHPALGLFLLGWTIFTAFMTLGTLKTNVALISVFVLLTITFLLLTIAELGGGSAFAVLGGYFGVATALVAWYTAAAGVYNATNPGFALPVGPRS